MADDPLTPTSEGLPIELLKPYFDQGHRGDVDRTQIWAMLKLTPQERLQRLAQFVEFVNRNTPSDAKLLRRRLNKAGRGEG